MNEPPTQSPTQSSTQGDLFREVIPTYGLSYRSLKRFIDLVYEDKNVSAVSDKYKFYVPQRLNSIQYEEIGYMRSASSDEVKLFLDKKQMERIEKHIEAKDKDARVLQRELEPLLKLVKDHKPELKEEGQIPVEKEGVYIMWLACAIEACRVQGSLAGALKSRRLTAEERESEVKGKEKELRKELGLDAYADMLEKKFAEKLEEPDQKSNGLDQQSKGHDQKTVGEDRITEEQQTKVTTKEDFDLKPLEEKVENIKKNVERIKKTRLDARMERKGDQKQVEPRNPLEEYVQSKICQT